ncbi:MAG: PEPxxWA-CTERM sorting domain-containing protein [Proteobacteria bacterium]|nr:PEPxxWA-CTERM sorting domain-containing protein [Pseudomonadota bacterium]
MKTKLIKIAAILTASSLPHISAAADWSIQGLGENRYVMDINNNGQIFSYYGRYGSYDGYTCSSWCSVVTGNDGVGLVAISDSFSDRFTSINDRGQIVGYTNVNSVYKPFITDATGIRTSIIAPDGSIPGKAIINNSGQVASLYYDNVHPNPIAFISNIDGTNPKYIGTLGGTYSDVTGINDSGQVVGVSTTPTNEQSHAFYTGPNGAGIFDLGTLGGAFSTATAINNNGDIVGSSKTSDNNLHAFFVDHTNNNMIDLGAMGGNYSEAIGINNRGDIIGTVSTGEFAEYHESFLYTHGEMVNLSKLDIFLNDGWSNLFVRGINDHGQIVGTGEHSNTYQSFLLTMTDDPNFYANYVTVPFSEPAIVPPPVPEPQTYAMLLAGLGLVGFMARRRK